MKVFIVTQDSMYEHYRGVFMSKILAIKFIVNKRFHPNIDLCPQIEKIEELAEGWYAIRFDDNKDEDKWDLEWRIQEQIPATDVADIVGSTRKLPL